MGEAQPGVALFKVPKAPSQARDGRFPVLQPNYGAHDRVTATGAQTNRVRNLPCAPGHLISGMVDQFVPRREIKVLPGAPIYKANQILINSLEEVRQTRRSGGTARARYPGGAGKPGNERMTAAELRVALKALRLRERLLADRLGVAPDTVTAGQTAACRCRNMPSPSSNCC